MNELISIIVPVYNAEKTLERCISALIGQTHQNIEIILVNDGSKDRSLEICHCFAEKDSRILVIDKPNGGVSSARNAGLDAAKGEFVMFCDSDDWAEPNWCEELLSHHKENCLIMCGFYVEGSQTYVPHEIRAAGEAELYARKEFYKLKLCGFNAPWNKIYSASVIRAERLRFKEELTNGEDYLFVLQYLTFITGNILFLNKCVFHYEWPREYSLSRKVPDDYLKQCCLLCNSVFEQIVRLGFESKVGYQQISTDFYNEFQKIVLSTIHDEQLGAKDKIKKMTAIMTTPEYQRCAVQAHISSNPVYSYLCRRKNGIWLWLWHQIR